jgi:hypothetical protein
MLVIDMDDHLVDRRSYHWKKIKKCFKAQEKEYVILASGRPTP